ncbi:hypothetical protein MTR67_016441 [Solanum verrucosum]|uniref:Glycosyltransferase N-terminal domain-containing protein n=1 Tax=Solanum verrucosum TaxID=315347 RepID=A0AAF0QGV5_SOLVR|nr:hypothetical protein MTR67_016441 [Solanum verrucosum]
MLKYPFSLKLGHLNQLLQFVCLISSYGLIVYYVGLANYNHQAMVRANALNPSDIAKIPLIWDTFLIEFKVDTLKKYKRMNIDKPASTYHREDTTQVQNSAFMCSDENLLNHEFSKLKQDEVAIVMVPFPAQGHLNQLLQLSCLISSYGLPVYYVGSATHNRQARIRANALNPSDIAKVHFHDIPTPEFASPSPDFNALSKFPSHLQPSWNASMLLRDPIASFLHDISSKSRRVIVVHDPLMSYNVHDVSSLPNAESYMFNCISALTSYSLISLFFGMSDQHEEESLKKLPSLEGIMTDEIRDLSASQQRYLDI